jgi:hypothetical protein
LNLPCNLKEVGIDCYERQAAEVRKAAPRTIYAELIEVRSPVKLPRELQERQPRYLARYWFFYYFDDWQWSLNQRTFTQAHEGDWEGITIGLDAKLNGLWAAYNQHCSGTWRKWEDVPKPSQNHGVVYVGLGSHASYYTRDPRPTYPLQCVLKLSSESYVGQVIHRLKGLVEERSGVVDTTGNSDELGPQHVASGAAQLVDLASIRDDWKKFDGVWGEDQYLYLGHRPGILNAGLKTSPQTPSFGSARVSDFWHDRWT